MKATRIFSLALILLSCLSGRSIASGIEDRIVAQPGTRYEQSLRSLLEQLPEAVRADLDRKQVSIVLLGDSSAIERLFDRTDRLSGYSHYPTATVYVECVYRAGLERRYLDRYGEASGYSLDRLNELYISGILLHELGHFIDYEPSTGHRHSDCDAFREVFSAERACFEETDYCRLVAMGYTAANEREYLAEAFAAYLLFPDSLSDSVPLTYAFLTELLNEE